MLPSGILIVNQVPPPSLREILGAYKSKGDGDREMLIAMLNAKSAEDQASLPLNFLLPVLTPFRLQRLASVASLHKTLLEMSAVDGWHSSPSAPSHPLPTPYPKHEQKHSIDVSNERVSPPVVREPPQLSQPPRKRQRSSHSPPAPHYELRPSHTSSRDLPPSPYSSRSDSEEYSPRSRASMAIGSLLSTGPSRDTTAEDHQNPSEITQHISSSSAGGLAL